MPRTPEQLIQHLRSEAARRGSQNSRTLVDAGQAHLIETRLSDALLNQEWLVKRFVQVVFGQDFFTDLSRAEFYALRDWLLEMVGPAITTGGKRPYRAEAIDELRSWAESVAPASPPIQANEDE